MADSEPFLFVSHVSEDRAAALAIVDELERRGIPCWIAPRNINPGRPFDDAIVAAIESSRAILLIFSDLCNECEYIRREVTVAGESQKLIIPFRIEDAQPRRGLRVRLSDLHWLDGFAARERAIEELARTLESGTGGKAPPPDGGERLPAEAPRHRDESGAGSASAERGKPPDQAGEAAPLAVALRPPVKGSRAVLAGAALALAVAGIAAGAWLWSGGSRDKPMPVPAAPVAADAANKGKAAFDRHDYTEAMRWDRQAAEQDHATAQTYVGYLYEKGLGVPRDDAEALSWYRKAAAAGHAAAQRNIGTFYEQGIGVPQDYAEALKWYRLAAAQGNAGAQTNIGYLFEKSLGVTQDYAEALSWYRMAAEHGEAMAENNIGAFYANGHGVAQDYGEALRWYGTAAERGNIDAEYNLALLYAEGRGVPADLAQARVWMQKAAEAGDPVARKWLDMHGG